MTTNNEQQELTHQEKVEDIRQIMRELGLPTTIPPHEVSIENYHPDICTRINKKFVVMDVINSEGQFNFDIGGLVTLLITKDIIDWCVAIVSDDVFPEVLERIKRFRNEKFERLVIIPINELREWFKDRIDESDIWKPDDLK